LLDVNGSGRFANTLITLSSSNSVLSLLNNAANGKDWILQSYLNGEFYIGVNGVANYLTLGTTGAATFSSSVTAVSFFETSDIRLKDIISTTMSLDGISTITYKWKDGRDLFPHVGYSAQEVEKVLPSAVKEDQDGFKTVKYNEVQAYKIAMLEKEIAELKEIVNTLKNK